VCGKVRKWGSDYGKNIGGIKHPEAQRMLLFTRHSISSIY